MTACLAVKPMTGIEEGKPYCCIRKNVHRRVTLSWENRSGNDGAGEGLMVRASCRNRGSPGYVT